MGLMERGTGGPGVPIQSPPSPARDSSFRVILHWGLQAWGSRGENGGSPVVATKTQLFSGLCVHSLGLAVIEFTSVGPQGITADLRYPWSVNQNGSCYSVDPIPHFNMPSKRQNLVDSRPAITED